MPISNPSSQFGNSSFVVDPTLGVGSFQTIAAALAASSSGDTIYIRPGTYTEDLTADMGGKSLVAATASGTNAFEVLVEGNHVYDSTANVSFQNISFHAASGIAFNVGAAGAGTYSAVFDGCSIASDDNIALQSASAAGMVNIDAFNTILDGNTQGGKFSTGAVDLQNCQVSGGSAEGIEASVSASVNIFNSTVAAATSNAVLVSAASGAVTSQSSYYTAGNAVFRFTANGSVRSISDQINASNVSGDWVDASAAVGSLSYANAMMLGSATEIDTQVSSTQIQVEGGGGTGLSAWLDNPAGGVDLIPNRGYLLSSGAKSFALPSVSSVGDEVKVVLRGGTSWTITQGAGQTIYIGSVSTTTGAGGSLASSADGDAITMVCQVANTDWVVYDLVGNITVV